MRLIDEIEAAAKRTAELGQLGLTPTVEQADAYALVHYDKTYWPRIKSALEAGEEMAAWIISEDECGKGVASIALANAFRFRAAAGEGS